jgi:K+-sensing histidine kinase KdpD
MAIALIPLRGHVDNDVMALALVIPVLLAAVLGGRWPGAASALVAAICFDFFFTLPYQSLRIASGDDISTFVVLLIVALIAAEVGIRARRGGRAARESRSDLDRLVRVIDIAAHEGDIEDVVSSRRADRVVRAGRLRLRKLVRAPGDAAPRSTARSRARRLSPPTPISCFRPAGSRSKSSAAASTSAGW